MSGHSKGRYIKDHMHSNMIGMSANIQMSLRFLSGVLDFGILTTISFPPAIPDMCNVDVFFFHVTFGSGSGAACFIRCVDVSKVGDLRSFRSSL